jgi:glycosyltransferase involved in cell wall biosynthesis
VYPKVSIVVTTRNEEENIRNCLESISEQNYNAIELIVIDNNSTDQTKAIAKEFTSLVINKGPERSAQRNEGLLRIASGDFCMYLDADMILTPTLVSDCVAFAASRNLGALYIPEWVLGRSVFARIRRFERGYYSGTPIDAARFFSTDLIRKVGGFDESLFKSGSGEDWDLDKQIKQFAKIQLLSAENDLDLESTAYRVSLDTFSDLNSRFVGILHNESQDQLIPYLLKKRYYSTGFDGYIQKWGVNDSDVNFQLSILSRFFKVFFLRGNWRRTFRHPILFAGTVALKLAIGICVIDKFGPFGKFFAWFKSK